MPTRSPRLDPQLAYSRDRGLTSQVGVLFEILKLIVHGLGMDRAEQGSVCDMCKMVDLSMLY